MSDVTEHFNKIYCSIRLIPVFQLELLNTGFKKLNISIMIKDKEINKHFKKEHKASKECSEKWI